MKNIYIAIIVLFSAIEADAMESSINISHNECLKYRYGHTIGGTMHSRLVQKRKLKKMATYSEKEAFDLLAKIYSLESLNLFVKNCNVYFKAFTKEGEIDEGINNIVSFYIFSRSCTFDTKRD